MHHERESTLISFVLHSFLDDTFFRYLPVEMPSNVLGTPDFKCWFPRLKKAAIVLSLGKDPSSRARVVLDRYKVGLVYVDTGRDKVTITSNSDLLLVGRQCPTNGNVKVFATVKDNHDEQKSTTFDSTTESSTQTVHSPTTITKLATDEMVTYVVKLALVGGSRAGKKDNNSTLT
jgi:hypothetical protein